MKSIESKLTHFALAALLAAALVGFLTATIFVHLKRETARDATISSLSKSLDQQINSVLLAFLLPEQQTGLSQLLGEIRQNEALSEILIFQSEPPENFRSCAPPAEWCQSDDAAQTAVVRTIEEGHRVYGRLLKAKENQSQLFESLIYRGVLLIMAAVGAALAVLFLLVRSFLRRDISDSLARLLTGLEQSLSGESDAGGGLNSKYIEFSRLESSIRGLIADYKRTQKEALLAGFATQVAHDIRSPLTALQIATRDGEEFNEERRILVRNAANRIRDIANDLITRFKQNKPESASPSPPRLSAQHIPLLAESVVSEKRLALRGRRGIVIDFTMDDSAYAAFAQIDSVSMKRVLSNLIENAIEAMPQEGRIQVSVFCDEMNLLIRIDDNGCGIPAFALERIGQRGFSFGKENGHSGSGLGVYHALETVKAVGGRLKIESWEGKATQVSIILPRCDAPAWFIPFLSVSQAHLVVVIDDCSSVHEVWKRRLEAHFSHDDASAEIKHFYSVADFTRWHQETPLRDDRPVIYLIDFEFVGEQMNGLRLIEALNLQNRAILVTSRFEEEAIIRTCLAQKLRILPKALATSLPLIPRPAPASAPMPAREAILFEGKRDGRACDVAT